MARLELSARLRDDLATCIVSSSDDIAGTEYAGTNPGTGRRSTCIRKGRPSENRDQQTPVPGCAWMGRRLDRVGRIWAIATGPGGRELHLGLNRRDLGRRAASILCRRAEILGEKRRKQNQ